MLTKESIVHQHSMQDYRNKKKEVVIPVLKMLLEAHDCAAGSGEDADGLLD